MGERISDVCKTCSGKKLDSTRGYVCHCGKKKDWYSKECKVCLRNSGAFITWTESEIAFLRVNYAEQGADWCAQQLGLDKIKVRDKANRLRLTLNQSAVKRIVNSKAAEYMKTHNPTLIPGTRRRAAVFLRNNPSSLERKLHGILDGMNIAYQTQVYMGRGFIVDALVGNIVIEADGDWWHGHPRFRPFNEKQIEQHRRDRRKDCYLYKLGYIVERIWESDMNEPTVSRVLKRHGISYR